MMTLLRLFVEFLLTGLLAVGGGLATLPFLYDIGARTGWFTDADVLNMIAVSESTPGPIGINMATYTGFLTSGVLGSLTATFGIILPAFVTICIVARFLDKYKSSPLTQGTFKTLRPASSALITAAGLSVLRLTVFPNGFDLSSFTAFFSAVNYKSLILVAVIFVGTQLWKKGHPVVFILAAAVMGIVFKL